MNEYRPEPLVPDYPGPDRLAARVAELERELAQLRAGRQWPAGIEAGYILEGAPDGFVSCDADFRILYLNAAAERCFARPRAELAGRTLWDAFPGTAGAEIEPRLRQVIRTRAPSSFESYCAPWEKWFEVRAEPTAPGGISLWLRDVTAHKQAVAERERVTRKAEPERQLLGEIVQNSPVRIAVVRGPEFVYELVNPAYQALAPGKEMAGRRMLEVWQEVADRLRPILERCLATGQPFHAEDEPYVIFRAPDVPAEQIYVTFSMVPLRGSDGASERILILVVDTTESVRQRRDLEGALARQEAIVASMSEGLLIADRSGKIVAINPAGRRFCRCDDAGTALSSPKDLREFEISSLDGRPLPLDERPLARVLAGETIANLEVGLRLLDTGETWIGSMSGTPLRDPSGEVAFAVMTMRDITAQTHSETALRESEKRFRAIFQQAAVGVAQVSQEGVWLLLNDRYCEILGYSREELRGQGFPALTHPDDLEGDLAQFRRMQSGEIATYTREKRYIRKDGGIVWVNLCASAVRDQTGQVACYVAVAEDITVRKRATEDAEHGREHLRMALNLAGVASWEWDPATGSAYWSPEMYPLFETEPRSGDPMAAWLSRVHPVDRLRIVRGLARCMRSGSSDFEYRCLSPTGATRWFSAAARTLPNGRILGLAADITLRKQREEEQRQNERQFQILADSIPQLAWMADEKGWIFWYNHRWYEYTGTTLEEMQGWGWRKVHDPAHLDRVLSHWRSHLDAGETWEDTFPLRGADGRYRWFLSRAMPIRNSEGRVVRWFGTNTDITERLETEQRLRASEERFRRLYESDIAGIVAADVERITDANDVFLKMVGYTREDLAAGRLRWADLTPPEYRRANEDCLRQLAEKGSCPPFEKELFRKDGGRVPILLGATLLERSPLRWLSIVLDLRERKQLERRVLDAQKLESVGLLAGGIAHDFNNLLVGVIGAASLAQEMLPRETPVADLLERIVKTGESAAHLTRQMLAYAGKGRFVVEPVDLSELLEEFAGLVQPSIPKKIVLSFELERNLPFVEADCGQMQQVFLGLVMNAAEAIGAEEGRIRVRTTALALDEAAVRREWPDAELAPGTYVCLEVADTGCGMDEETRRRAFEPFFTTKFTGRGLGLAAAGGIVRSHRGAIQVTSAPGRGSTFRVLLPACESARAASASASADLLAGSGTILVVDDEELVRQIARHALERYGYRVLVASSGAAAVEALRGDPEGISLVLLDLSMPGMSGEETLSALRAIRPGLPVLISSGYTATETMRLFEGCRISGFVQKPFTPVRLAEQVRGALAVSSASATDA